MPTLFQRFFSLTIVFAVLSLLSACGESATVSGPALEVQADEVEQPVTPNTPDSDNSDTATTGEDAAAGNDSDTANDSGTGSGSGTETDNDNDNDSSVDESPPAPSQAPLLQQPLAEEFELPPAPTPAPADPAEQADAPVNDQPSEPEPAPKNYTVADITDLILITGQSNALGADTDYDFNLDGPHDRVFAFTEQGWSKADLHQVWDLGWFPRGNPGTDPNNNLALHFGKKVASRHSHRVVGIILATAPGMGIEHWSAGGEFFDLIDRKVIDAVNQTPHKSGLDGILWHQGESDEGDLDYHLKLDSTIDQFRQQSWFASDRPFICGETAAFEIVNRQLMDLNNNGDQWSACVESGGLQTREDGFHFNAAGLRGLGRRYAEKYLEVIQ